MTGKCTLHRRVIGAPASDRYDRATSLASGCIGKQGYASWDEANRIVQRRQKSARRKKQQRADRASLRPYRCRHCHQWHIAGGQIP